MNAYSKIMFPLALVAFLPVGAVEPGANSDPSPTVADQLQPGLCDYDAPATKLRAGFVPDKPQLVWGEPLQITFIVTNLGPQDFEFMFGGDYRGTGRHDRFKTTVTDAAGQFLPDPHGTAFDFGGI